MANITALLKINEQGNGEIETAKFFVKQNNSWVLANSNNISAIAYETDFKRAIDNETSENRDYIGASGTPIGLLKVSDVRFGINESGNQTENYKGLIFGYTDENAEYESKIEIVGTDILDFSIYFDPTQDLYPTTFTYTDINGNSVTKTNSSHIISLNNLVAGYGTTTIEFTTWNRPNKSVMITYFENIPLDITLSKQWIDNFETQSQITSDINGIQYGVLANTGSITFVDYNNVLYQKALLGHLNAYIFDLSLFINGNLIQTHISTESPLYSQNNTIDLNLTNKIALWNDIQIENVGFGAGYNLYEILQYIMAYDEDYDPASLNFREMTERYGIVVGDGNSIPYTRLTTVKDYLTNIEISNPLDLESGTLLQQLEKICQVAQLQCYQDDDGIMVLRSARPIFYYDEESDIIEIPYSKQTSPLSYEILVSNRFEDVNFK